MPRFNTILLSAVLLATSGCYTTAKPAHIGEAAQAFSVQDSDHKVALADFQGSGKIVVLNFWASYCPPCIEELPSLMAMQEQLKDRVTVVTISIDTDDAAYHQFLQQRGVSLISVRDADQKVNLLYGTIKIPETYIIDRNGLVQRKFISSVDWTSPEVMEYLRKL